ncbi:hypothetical protein MSG28_007053 [Choristoneura fumiferana]|uniref:Uncharacterized protein n=1 Tax=Choristoneura fumiferana TaxID=7141 RepID=A0ACC0JN09_CHOFU|nr:hypothetical protein MSG28_007053 [Choristoneura fumiferana]
MSGETFTHRQNPCLYILRFSSQLQFEDKQHEVSMTALRLVQRMKRDSIHSGRRPSGICGAALLIAARLHSFSRTPSDVVRIVKVHESTLRKRLLEFGDTPSSALTLEEFMTVDLEEEQDPPAFRAARKRDKERLQKLMEEEDGEREMTDLQKEIDAQLEKDNSRRRKAAASSTPSSVLGVDAGASEDADASRFAAEDTLTLLGEIANEMQPKSEEVQKQEKMKLEKGLGPDLAVIGLGQPEEKNEKFLKPEPKSHFAKDLHNADELILGPSEEDYISSLIMSEEEARHKTKLWNQINAGYLREQKIKEEMRAKEKEEGKDKKKKVRGSYKKKTPCNAATAGEAIEKMLAEKRISMKINYNILKTLDHPGAPVSPVRETATPVVESKPPTPIQVPASPVPKKRKKKAPTIPTLNVASPSPAEPRTPGPKTPAPATPKAATPALVGIQRHLAATDAGEDYDEDAEPEPTDAASELSLGALLRNEQDDDYYDYEEY